MKFFKSLGKATSALAGASSYREWWNSASQNMEQAYATTIAPQDEAAYRLRGWHGDTNSYGARHFIEEIGLGKESVVLEIGCGIARIGRELAPHIREWHGADISPNMLNLAKERCAGVPNVKFIELSDIHALRQLPAGTYDFVYATIVLMHLDKEDLLEYLRQAFRLLKTDGKAYFDTWNILHPDTLRMWVESCPPGDDKPRGRFQCATPEELETFLRFAGFDVTRVDRGERLVRTFSTKRTEAAETVADDKLPPFGYVGNPHFGEEVSGTVRIDGWALDHVTAVTITIDGNPAGAAILGENYPGVEKHFQHYMPGSRQSGFYLDFDTTSLKDGVHELVVTAVDRDGRSATVSGVSYVFRVKNS